MEDDLNVSQIKDNLNIETNGRQPGYFSKLKMKDDFIIWQIEDDLNIFTNGR
jgi:hypothetical protein